MHVQCVVPTRRGLTLQCSVQSHTSRSTEFGLRRGALRPEHRCNPAAALPRPQDRVPYRRRHRSCPQWPSLAASCWRWRWCCWPRLRSRGVIPATRLCLPRPAGHSARWTSIAASADVARPAPTPFSSRHAAARATKRTLADSASATALSIRSRAQALAS